MTLEWGILGAVWLLSLALLIFMVPKDRVRVAHTAFMFKQMITWFFGLIVVELGMLEYPVRELASVNRTSFTFEFLAYPAVCAVFNARYPSGRGLLFQFSYFGIYCTAMTVVEVMIEKNTKLIDYLEWNWYWTWCTLFLTLLCSRLFCVWFFKKRREPAKWQDSCGENG
ncbi:MAG: hypothetical protein K0R28_3946 [Paenibacillus sp.]|nr:hypothetical protein [Paenibacillus sp.]